MTRHTTFWECGVGNDVATQESGVLFALIKPGLGHCLKAASLDSRARDPTGTRLQGGVVNVKAELQALGSCKRTL